MSAMGMERVGPQTFPPDTLVLLVHADDVFHVLDIALAGDEVA
jgi:hypothetical protein